MRNEKQCLILDRAFHVFARFGLKKTSIDDIAKAAEISRQGVYLHFKNKEEIFKSSVEKYLEDQNAASMAKLKAKGKLEERLLASLFEWLGKSIGLIHQDAVDVIEEGKEIVLPMFMDYTKAFKAATAKAIEKDSKAGKKQSEELADILYACGMTWKHDLTSQEEFKKKMQRTIEILLKSLDAR